jgi:MSHA biogenesis protein MshG
MSHFLFRACDAGGKVQEGRMEAVDMEAALIQLGAWKLVPIDVREEQPPFDPLQALEKKLRGHKPGGNDLILFSRQMYSLLHAGVPIIQALSRLRDSTDNPRFREVLDDIIDSLDAGNDIAISFGRHDEIFSPLYLSMLRVGEMTGRVDEAFLNMYEYLDRDKVTVDRIKAAMRYPSFVIAAIMVAMAVLTMKVIPVFSKVFAGAHLELPWPTKVILAVSNFAAAYWWQVLLVVAVIIVAVLRWVSTEAGRYWWDRTKLSIPKIGDIILRGSLARATRAFSITLGAGVPITQAINSVAHASDNTYLIGKIMTMRTGIEKGDTLLRSAEQIGVFTPVILQMIAVGEETGRVDAMMRDVADFYDREVEYDIANLSAVIEPLLTIVIGAMVLVLALGVFMPMWDLTQMARQR